MIASGIRALIVGMSAPLQFDAVDDAGVSVPGSATIVYRIRRTAGANPWWNGATWVAAEPAANAMTEDGDFDALYCDDWTPNLPGWYDAECWDTDPLHNVRVGRELFQAVTAVVGPSATTITVRNAATLAPISGATVLILDSTGLYVCGLATSNGAGQAVFHLSDGTYTLRALAVGYTFADAVLTVAGATAQNIDGTAYTAHPSPVVVVVCGSVGTVVGAIAEVVQGDTTTPLEGRLREANGTTVVDLSTAVAVTFRMREGGTGTAIGGVCSITDAVNGKVQYFWGAHDLDTVGNYLAEFEVQWPGPLYETFPARAPFEIHVRPELG